MPADNRFVGHDARGPGERRAGTVAWVDAARGFAFIAPDGGGPDLFVDMESPRIRGQLEQGTAVAFECQAGAKGRLVVRNVVRIDASLDRR